MTIDYARLKARPFPVLRQRYDERDTMLYALALGVAHDPADAAALRFVYERDLRALPTMCVVLAHPGFWAREPDTGIDWVHVLHAEQRVTIHRPLAPRGDVIGRVRVSAITDKGAGKGALVVTERVLADAEGDRRIATIRQVSFCRGDGGYGSNGQPSDPPLPPLPPCPDARPDLVFDSPTRADAALLYRLCADRNPLHADPAVARAAGFDRPILHGLASYGIAGHALVRCACDADPARLGRFDVRFTAPVYPGETVRTEIWRDGLRAHVRCRVLERDVVVIDQGIAELSGPQAPEAGHA